MNKVTAVIANYDFSLDLQFNDGSVKRFDVKPYLDYEVFRELKDLNRTKLRSVSFMTSPFFVTSDDLMTYTY